jgi:hypothetical protein
MSLGGGKIVVTASRRTLCEGPMDLSGWHRIVFGIVGETLSRFVDGEEIGISSVSRSFWMTADLGGGVERRIAVIELDRKRLQPLLAFLR